MSNNSVNCWKPPSGQSAAEPLLEEGSTTSRKAYTQVGGSAEHPEKDDDIVCSSRQLEAAKQGKFKLYKITTIASDGVYYGITSLSLDRRFSSHKCAAKKINNKLYAAMRKYGVDTFSIELVESFDSLDEVCLAEQRIITTSQERLYNLAKGGQTGYSMTNDSRYSEWKSKLKKAREGRKPALGMKHSEENRTLFSQCGKSRWDKYGRYPIEVIQCGFTEANKKFGISKTHYYRMRRLNNEQL